MQTPKQSFIEAVMNVLVGYGIAVTSQIIIFPWYGVSLPLGDNLLIGVWFTIISLVRSYLIRRFYNWKHAPVPVRTAYIGRSQPGWLAPKEGNA